MAVFKPPIWRHEQVVVWIAWRDVEAVRNVLEVPQFFEQSPLQFMRARAHLLKEHGHSTIDQGDIDTALARLEERIRDGTLKPDNCMRYLVKEVRLTFPAARPGHQLSIWREPIGKEHFTKLFLGESFHDVFRASRELYSCGMRTNAFRNFDEMYRYWPVLLAILREMTRVAGGMAPALRVRMGFTNTKMPGSGPNFRTISDTAGLLTGTP